MPSWRTSRRTEGIDITFSATSRLNPAMNAKASWCNPKVLVIFAVLFIAGVACGAMLTSMVFHWRIHSAVLAPVSLGELRDRLHLTPDQQQVVAKELDDYVKYYQNIEEEREDVAEHGKRRIMSVLNPDQRKQFLEMFKASTLQTKADSDQ
jgi:uncharacterized membrane protein YciS (DUF1049 family)